MLKWKIHSPQELAAELGQAIVGARMLQHSEDTVILDLDLADGSRRIYKNQFGPSVEAAFYSEADCELLAEHRILIREPGLTAILVRHMDQAALSSRQIDAPEALDISGRIHNQLNKLSTDRISWAWTLHSVEDMLRLYSDMLDSLYSFASDKTIELISTDVIELYRNLSIGQKIMPVWEGQVGPIHGDLHADNIFVFPDGKIKVIDWQWAMIGPQVLDKACLLETLGIEPEPYVGTSATLAMHCLRLCENADTYMWHLQNGTPVDRLKNKERFLIYCLGIIFRLCTMTGN
jgi:thiamine kinase-like enzyme